MWLSFICGLFPATLITVVHMQPNTLNSSLRDRVSSGGAHGFEWKVNYVPGFGFVRVSFFPFQKIYFMQKFATTSNNLPGDFWIRSIIS